MLSTSNAQCAIFGVFQHHAAHAGDLLQPLPHFAVIQIAAGSGNLDRHRFGAAQPVGQVGDSVLRHKLALVDDDDAFAGMLDFREDVGAQDDGVVAGEAADELARFDDLLGVEAGGRLVENQDIGVMQDGLRQTHALPVALGELADELVLDVANGAAVAHFVDALGRRRRWRGPSAVPTKVRYSLTSMSGIERRGFGKIADAFLHFEGLLEDIETGHVRLARGGGQEAGEDAHSGSLSGPVGSEKANNLAFFHLEGDVIDGDGTSVSLRQTFDFNHSESQPINSERAKGASGDAGTRQRSQN